jgi:hypothetical protein
MIYNTTAIDLLASKVAEETARQTEMAILGQLNDFISRNLIEVHTSELRLGFNPEVNRVEISRNVQLVLKDKEYIEKLEKENAELKQRLAAINMALKNV